MADFKCVLARLAKDCEFKDVSAAQYRDDLIRDSFISGIMSAEIRQRLLEKKDLNMKEAYDIALTIQDAKHDNQIFCNSPNEHSHLKTSTENASVDACAVEAENETISAVNVQNSVCNKCASSKPHDYKRCKAGLLTCYSCGEKGHLSRACRLQRKGNSQKRYQKGRKENSAAVEVSSQESDDNFIVALQTLSTCGDEKADKVSNTITVSEIKGKFYRTLLDSGSTKCFVREVVADNFGVQKVPYSFEVGMAQATNRVNIKGSCTVTVKVLGRTYKDLTLYVMKDLCSDVILGLDFLGLHEAVTFKFGGSLDHLIVPRSAICAVAAAKVKTPSLFSNLISGWKPMASKSRRYNSIDKEFIVNTVDGWKQAGTIRPSHSPWRAQCVVVKRDGKPQRVAIDYSQTVNLFTERDSFPIPLIDELINQLAPFKFYASYDLKKAYYQVPICESDKPFTAFEACGELFEFNVMPFGVTNGGPVFQRVMNDVVKEDHLCNTYVYFDNVVIGANSLKELDVRSSKFKKALSKRDMVLNESKTVYGVNEVNILGYRIGNGIIKPDPERLKPLLDLPPPTSQKSLKRALGMFAYYAKWISKFSDRISNLKSCKRFPLSSIELNDFEGLKRAIAKSALQAIDEEHPFTVECDASEVAVSATLNQRGRPVGFMTRSLSGSELKYPAIEKEAMSIIEAVRKWEHLLMRRHFTLITDQRSVAFMLDSRARTKVKHNKIQCWRLELASFSYTIRYRPGKENVGADTLSRASCSAITSFESRLLQLHKALCCPGITRMWNFVRSKNLPFSLEDVKKCTSNCFTCAEIKPQFVSLNNSTLIKATSPMERLNLDFKGSLPSTSRNRFFLCVVDEYSRYPFCFPCTDTSAGTIIRCLESIFSLFGICSYVHSDRGTAFMSRDLKNYLFQRGIACSRTTPYHPIGNAQCERYNGVLWKAMKCALRSRNLKVAKWETVVPTALDSVRSLLCTSTGVTPHSRFLNFSRRSSNGKSLPEWLCTPGPVLLRKFVRSGKTDDVVQRVELIEANPTYARIRYSDGRECTVSLRDLARCPREEISLDEDDEIDMNDKDDNRGIESVRVPDNDVDDQLDQISNKSHESVICETDRSVNTAESERVPINSNGDDRMTRVVAPRRSIRKNIGVPPERYGSSSLS